MATIAVIGGGISGLSTAYFLSTMGGTVFKRILLIESSKRVGGWIKTIKLKDGNIHELGPRMLKPIGLPGELALRLSDELLLHDEILFMDKTHPAAKNHYIYINGSLQKVPSSFLEAIRTNKNFAPHSMAYYMIRNWFRRKKEIRGDDNIYRFISKQFDRWIAETMIGPYYRGLKFGDIKHLSAKSLLPPGYFAATQKMGSVMRGRKSLPTEPIARSAVESIFTMSTVLLREAKDRNWSAWSYIDGMESLPRAMFENLARNENVEIYLNYKATKVEDDWSRRKVILTVSDVETEKKFEFPVDHVFSSIFAPRFGDILRKHHPELAFPLSLIRAVTVATVNLEYRVNIRIPFIGSGHSIPSFENPAVLEIRYDSCCFPMHAKTPDTLRLTVVLGGAWFEECFGDPLKAPINEDKIRQAALSAVHEQLGISQDPHEIILNVNIDSQPHYGVGHKDYVIDLYRVIHEHRLPFSLVGSSYYGTSVTDCIFYSLLEVDRVKRLWTRRLNAWQKTVEFLRREQREEMRLESEEEEKRKKIESLSFDENQATTRQIEQNVNNADSVSKSETNMRTFESEIEELKDSPQVENTSEFTTSDKNRHPGKKVRFADENNDESTMVQK